MRLGIFLLLSTALVAQVPIGGITWAPAAGGGSASVVQQKLCHDPTPSGATAACSFTGTGSGNYLWIGSIIHGSSTATVNSATCGGTTATSLGTSTGGGSISMAGRHLYVSGQAAGTTSCTFTYSSDPSHGGSNHFDIWVVEVTGTTGVDVSTGNNFVVSGSTTSYTTNLVTNFTDLILGAASSNNNVQSGGAGWTAGTGAIATGMKNGTMAVETEASVASGTIAVAFTLASADTGWLVGVAFK